MLLTHLVIFSFFNGATGSDAVVETPVVVQSGVKNKRRWALKRDGKFYYFPTVAALEAFSQSFDQVVIPEKTLKQAKKLSVKPSVSSFDGLRQMEREIEYALLVERMQRQKEEDDEFRDFMDFINNV